MEYIHMYMIYYCITYGVFCNDNLIIVLNALSRLDIFIAGTHSISTGIKYWHYLKCFGTLETERSADLRVELFLGVINKWS